MDEYVPPLAQELAARVWNNLALNRMTQAELARRVGATEKHVSRVLRGRDDGSVPFWDALLRESAGDVCPECRYVRPPYTGSGTPVYMPGRLHDADCPTLLRLSPEQEEAVRAKPREIAESQRGLRILAEGRRRPAAKVRNIMLD